MRQNLSSLTNLTHQYKAGDGNKRIKISNSLASINVVGNNENNKIKDQLVEFNSGEYLQTIEENCFKDCSKLKNVILQTKTNRILKNAFKNCTSLSSINIESIIFNTIEDSAFENIGIKDIQLKLFKQHDGTFGTDIFKSCKKLLTVALTTNYIPAKLFNDCTSLTSIYLTLSSVDGSMPYIDPDALYNIPSLTELTISGEFDAAPILSGFQQLNKVTIESNSNVQLNDKIFNNTPRLTQIDLSKCIRSIQQLSLNAFAGSSLKQITISAFSKTDLENSMLSYNKSDIVNWQYDVVENIIKVNDNQYLHGIGENKEGLGKFYYGKPYSKIPELIEYALEKKLPFIIFNIPYHMSQSAMYQIMRCKMLYDYLAQQKCLIGISYIEKYTGENSKITFNDIYDYYQGDEWDSKMLNPYAVVQREVKNTRYQNDTNRYANGTIWSCGYGGRNIIQYKYDGTTTIEYYKNGVQSNHYNTFVEKFGNINIPTTVYKFYNTNSIFQTHTITYDILTKQINKEICTCETEHTKKFASRLELKTQYMGERDYPWYSHEWSIDRHVNICLFVPYVIDFNLNKKTNYQLECSNKTKYSNLSKETFYNMDNPSSFFQKQNNVSKITTSRTRFKDVELMTIKNSTFVWQLLTGSNIAAKANGEIINDNNVKDKSAEIQKAYEEYKQSGYNSSGTESDAGIKNTLYKFDYYLNNWLKDYARDNTYNAPDYKPATIDFSHKKSKPIPSNCWAIDHDCTIICKNNIKVTWKNSNKKFV